MCCSTCKVLFLVVVAATLGHWVDGQKEEDNSCVQNIEVDTSGVETGSQYHFKIILTNESQCLYGKSAWVVDILECDGNRTLAFSSFDKPEGYLCPMAKCQRIRAGGVCSAPVNISDEINVSVAFHVFDITGLHLTIHSDERVRSWNLTILKCFEDLSCYKSKVIADTGNRSVLFIEENFLLDTCYGFKLQANSFGVCRVWVRGGIFISPSGCYPKNKKLKTSELVVVRKQSWWVVPLGAVAGVASLISIALLIFFRKHLKNVAMSKGMHESSGVALERASKHRPAVLILYAQDSEAHVAMVTQLILRLKEHLCQVFDIFDESNFEKLSNPSCWLQEIISTSSLKIVLVVSPRVMDYFHAVITTCVSSDTPGGWFNMDCNNRLLLAAIKHLFDKELVVNYNRVFVVR
ncbi:uncharacterized protein LOC135103769 [Scylla paramamosain]|uniref:uncharacterized protein LOC135103769 n=1 Tax=Scylla paramamosain TaxID=85552 RepID=UPI003083CF13